MADMIVAEGIGKRYHIGAEQAPYGRLTESLWNAARGLVGRRESRAAEREFWALRDVSFSIPQGSAVGIIGRNGAGKSTLLKVLARITEPTTGRAELRGRVGSLLEVGTGFHPELTGRENVFLSGAILGMRRAEIVHHFDEIVAFADIGRFLDTPVKRYSSGMKVRLGFAVAAFLEPEILFVDEVLAVGDADFQRKCLGKMSELGGGGRTVIFVSHNMGAVTRLCDRAILLDRGRMVTDGQTADVVRTYMESGSGPSGERSWRDPLHAPGDDVARLLSVRVLGPDGTPGHDVDITEPVNIEVVYESAAPGALRPYVSLHFFNENGVMLFASNDYNDRRWWAAPRKPGTVRAVCRIPGNFLAEGRVNVSTYIATLDPLVNHATEVDAVSFQVVDRSTGEGTRGPYAGDWPGAVRPYLEWRVGGTDAPPTLDDLREIADLQ
jgi:homopolymeric O-antigen transport system ATP-binding protein